VAPARFALCIPTHNGARYLPELAASIRAQTMPFDEVVLYDDASSDASVAVARSLGVFTRVVEGDANVGPAAARNRSLAATSAGWIHFQDHDDLMDPRYLERVSGVCEAHDVVLVNGHRVSDGGQPPCTLDYSGVNGAPDAVSYSLSTMIGGTFGLYRRSVLLAVGGFREELGRLGNEDPDLHVRLAAAGARFHALPEVLIRVRAHSGSMSGRWADCLQGAILCGRRWLEELPPRYHGLVLEQIARTARECDNNGLYAQADLAWDLLRARGARRFPSASPIVRRLGAVIGPGVASALRRGAVGVAARRLLGR
jgi:glycosyltransferase involved in cell wall biosynthesis